MPEIITAPSPLPTARPQLFLAGTIEMGRALNWQQSAAEAAAASGWTVLNPRRDGAVAWTQVVSSDPEFVEQVNWELDAQDHADRIVMNLLAGSFSPVSLLELGLYAASGKLVVICPPEFWRAGNVEIVCQRYSIPLVATIEEAIDPELLTRARANATPRPLYEGALAALRSGVVERHTPTRRRTSPLDAVDDELSITDYTPETRVSASDPASGASSHPTATSRVTQLHPSLLCDPAIDGSFLVRGSTGADHVPGSVADELSITGYIPETRVSASDPVLGASSQTTTPVMSEPELKELLSAAAPRLWRDYDGQLRYQYEEVVAAFATALARTLARAGAPTRYEHVHIGTGPSLDMSAAPLRDRVARAVITTPTQEKFVVSPMQEDPVNNETLDQALRLGADHQHIALYPGTAFDDCALCYLIDVIEEVPNSRARKATAFDKIVSVLWAEDHLEQIALALDLTNEVLSKVEYVGNSELTKKVNDFAGGTDMQDDLRAIAKIIDDTLAQVALPSIPEFAESRARTETRSEHPMSSEELLKGLEFPETTPWSWNKRIGPMSPEGDEWFIDAVLANGSRVAPRWLLRRNADTTWVMACDNEELSFFRFPDPESAAACAQAVDTLLRASLSHAIDHALRAPLDKS